MLLVLHPSGVVLDHSERLLARSGAFSAHSRAFWGRPGTFWEFVLMSSGIVLGHSGCVLELFLDHSGASWGHSGVFWGPFWSILVSFWSVLGAFWGRPGTFWGRSDEFWGRSGAFGQRSGTFWGCFLSVLDRFRFVLEHPGGVLHHFGPEQKSHASATSNSRAQRENRAQHTEIARAILKSCVRARDVPPLGARAGLASGPVSGPTARGAGHSGGACFGK